MVDCIKIQIYARALIDFFFNHPSLEWLGEEERLHYMHNDEILTKIRKQFRGIVFCFYNDKLDIIFKPHYYFNSNLHNANDFSPEDCMKVVADFQNAFEIDLGLLPIVNLEFGVNITQPYDIRDLITFLYSHGRNEFRADPDAPFSKKSQSYNKFGKPNTFKIFKGYAKGIQFPNYCHKDTFRWEQKSKRSKRMKDVHVETMADLLNYNSYLQMAKSLRNEFAKVLILDDTVSRQNLSADEKIELEKYMNPNTWYRLQQKSRNVFANHVKKFNALQQKSGKNMKQTIAELIDEKLEELFLKDKVCINHTIIDGNCTSCFGFNVLY